MGKQPKKKTSAPAQTSNDRRNNKPSKKRPKVFDPEKRRLVTKQ